MLNLVIALHVMRLSSEHLGGGISKRDRQRLTRQFMYAILVCAGVIFTVLMTTGAVLQLDQLGNKSDRDVLNFTVAMLIVFLAANAAGQTVSRYRLPLSTHGPMSSNRLLTIVGALMMSSATGHIILVIGPSLPTTLGIVLGGGMLALDIILAQRFAQSRYDDQDSECNQCHQPSQTE